MDGEEFEEAQRGPSRQVAAAIRVGSPNGEALNLKGCGDVQHPVKNYYIMLA